MCIFKHYNVTYSVDILKSELYTFCIHMLMKYVNLHAKMTFILY